MKFSDKHPFIIQNKKDLQLVELRKEFEKFLEDRREISKGTSTDSEIYLRILRGKKPKK